MKKLIFTTFTIFLVHSTFSQTTDIPGADAPSGYTVNTSWYQPYASTPLNIIRGEELWLRDESQPTNRLIGTGNTSYMRGNEPIPVVLILDGTITQGRIFAVNTGGNNSTGRRTTLIGFDDPERSSVTGFTQDRANRRQRTDDNAVSIFHRTWNVNNTDRRMGSWDFIEGNYFGGTGFSGLFVNHADTFTMTNASFVAGAYDGNQTFAPSGAWLNDLTGSLTISNRTGRSSDRFQGGTFDQLDRVGGGTFDKGSSALGGAGLAAGAITGGVLIEGGSFIGSQQAEGTERTLTYTAIDTQDANVQASGGHGAILSAVGGTTINDGLFIAGASGNVAVGGPDAYAEAIGGYGLALAASGITAINGGTYIGGQGGSATIQPVETIDPFKLVLLPPSAENGEANSLGGSGIYLNFAGATTIRNVDTRGARGGFASASQSATASGGSGLLAVNTAVTIHSGTFTGAAGGSANGENNVAAVGGSGAWVRRNNLTIHGGTFTGGAGGTENGEQAIDGAGVWVQDGNLTITEDTTDTLINGHVYLANTGSQTLNIQAGEITGDILKWGGGLATIRVGTNATYNGEFIQLDGNSDVQLGSAEEARFFSKVTIDNGNVKFSGKKVTTAAFSRFDLNGSSSSLSFDQGAELSQGSLINAGNGTVNVGSGANPGGLLMGDNSSIQLALNLLTDNGGLLNVSGDLVASNSQAQIRAAGIAPTSTGTNHIVTVLNGDIDVGARDLTDLVKVNFGWLTKVDEIMTNGAAGFGPGIDVSYEYNSLNNQPLLASVDDPVLAYVDGIISEFGTNDFYELNSIGAEKGTKNMIYSLSQMPDTADAAFNIQLQVAEQLSARGSEFRSMNGYASTKPAFARQAAPVGAAGPDAAHKKSLQGWIRSYGSFADHDANDGFAQYDNNTWGTVVGIDQCFGNLLLGLAGGYARTDLDGDTSYDGDMDTYFGSVYSTFGGETTFVDLALTYGQGDVDEDNSLTKGDFDTQVFSAYAGAGKAFGITDKFALTPEASFLASYYDQDSYTRKGAIVADDMKIDSYDEWSYLSSLGINLSTVHQIDWMNRGLALIPEARMHWLHEFNDDLDDVDFTLGGGLIPGTLDVRAREEDIFRLGLGFDAWSWKYQDAKFEIDYDALIASEYTQHVISGKITWRF